MTTQPSGPLAGVKVLDLSTVVMGSYATQILGDLGAEIVKVEHGDGDIMRRAGPSPADGMGAIFVGLNRNKRSITLDLKQAKSLEVLLKLAAQSDVFFTNVRMAGLKRLGLGYDDIRAVKDDSIYVHCTGYGEGGPHAGKPAYDDLIQAASGVADLSTIRDGGPPRYMPTLVADKVSGLHAVYATIAALYARSQTGAGQFIEAPMFETFASFNLVENLYGHTFVPPLAKPAYTRSVSDHRKPFPTKDGYIGLLPYNDEQWRVFFKLGGRPDLAEDLRFADFGSRTRNADDLYTAAAEVAMQRTTAEWLEALDSADIPAMKCNTLVDVLDEPHLRATGLIHERQHSAIGPYLCVGHPVKFSATPAGIRMDAPLLGEHTSAILAELGYSPDEIAEIVAEEEDGRVGQREDRKISQKGL